MNRIVNTVTFASSLLFAVACGAASAPAAAPSASPAAPSLDGTSYEVTLAFPGEPPLKDVLTFQSGAFESSACTSLGFPKWTDYRAQRSGDGSGIAFHVETHNPKGPSVEWEGTVQGGAASGKAKRTIDGNTALGTFQGVAR
jgi:hypothetical protein